MFHTLSRRLLLAAALLAPALSHGQKAMPQKTDRNGKLPAPVLMAKDTAKDGLMPYKKVITSKAVTQHGLFTVHAIGDKWYFELPDSLLSREMMVTTRLSKMAGGAGRYAGELENQQTVIWERGPNNKILLRVVTVVSVADSTNSIYEAVNNSNVYPIAAMFDIKCVGKDSSGVVIDVTDFFKGDNQPIGIGPYTKKQYNLSSQQGDKSYILSMHSFPINTEVKVVRTYASMPPTGPQQGPQTSTTLPAAYAAGNVTVEVNNSFILLPRKPMARRTFDPRVGFFADDFTMFGDDQQRSEDETFIVRWRLEPKPEDYDKWKRGELVDPAKPIVYYIDPATPKKWRPYLIQGVNDWQKAFERAGFKNAIMAKEWPKDSSMSLEDARYSVIRYLASDIENAYGPNVHDPRSGEILESHIGWYHNVMRLVHDWYMVQASPVDPQARSMKFNDTLMGQLIRFVSSHEVGHTLGLRHNMGSSSRTPVELLRNKAWVEAHGHTASIMDYARFNYVAQPEDNISEAGLFPRIGDYDMWAIQWGYKPSFATTEEADKKIVNQWVIDSLKSNPRLWFGTETNPYDPREQTEDLGDNAMTASAYGIRNLKRVMQNLQTWTKEDADKYENLDNMYNQVVSQFSLYIGHVTKNIGGIYETPKSVEESGVVYEPTPIAMQKSAMQFLQANLYNTPEWLMDKDILNKINDPINTERVNSLQARSINSLLSAGRLNRMVASANRFGTTKVYTADAMMDDLRKGLWSELATHKATTGDRRSMQATHITALIALLQSGAPSPAGNNPFAVQNQPVSEVSSIARAQLSTLRTQLLAAAPLTPDKLTKYHYQDMAARIKQALEPKG